MPKKKKSSYSELDEIKDDLDSLKTNVVELTKHMQKDGMAHAEEITEKAHQKIEKMAAKGRNNYKKLEKEVKDNPGRSVAFAFAGGLIASMLMHGRK